MPTRYNYDNMPSRLVTVFLLLALSIGLMGYLYYSTDKKQIKKNNEDEISAIADLKVYQIVGWRNDLMKTATGISRNEFVGAAVQRYLLHPGAPGLKEGILSWMQSIRQLSEYKNVLLVDTQGVIRLSTGPSEQALNPQAKRWLEEVVRDKQVFLSDIHLSQAVPSVHLDLFTPLIIKRGATRIPIGALVIHVDPEKYLYPLIQSWPGSSTTAETTLFRKEGEDIVFLNELRHRKNTALSLHIPMSKKRFPAAMAVAGNVGVYEGIDYRDVPVLAATRSIPGTAWFLVSKVDIDEIYAPIHQEAAEVSVVLSLLIAASGFMILLWWRQKNTEHLQEQLASELKRETLSQQYDLLSKYANDIILLVDSGGAIVEANDKAVSCYGYSREQLRRLTVRDIRAPETRSRIDANMALIQEQNGGIFETLHCRKDGTTFPVEVSSRVIDVEGKKYFQSIIRDISERKHAEQLLRENHLFLQTIIDTEPECVKLLGTDGSLIMMNRAGLEMIQAESFDQVKGQRMATLVTAEYQEAFIKMTEDVFQGISGRLEFEVIGRLGRRLWLETHVVPLRNAKNEITALLGITRNITDRKLAEKKVTHITRLYAFLGQVNQAIVRARDRDLLFHDICHIAVDYGGFRMAWIGLVDGATKLVKPVCFYGSEDGYLQMFRISAADEPEGRGPVGTAIREGRSFICDDFLSDPRMLLWRSAAEERGYRSLAAFPFKVRDKVIGALAIYSSEPNFFTRDEIKLLDEVAVDISFALEIMEKEEQRKQAEQALLESEKRYKRLVESVTDYIYSVTVEDGRAVSTNHSPGCETVTGYLSEEYGRDPDLWHRMIFEDDREYVIDQANKILSGASVQPFEHRITHKDGSIRWVRHTAVPRRDPEGKLIAYDGLITDITQFKLLENQLRQAQKMEAVGQLAGGVAHDFNNILTAIIGYGNLILMKMPQDDISRSYVDQILASAERAAHLTHSLLAFSRKQIIDLKAVSVNEIIRRVGKLLIRIIGEDIELQTRLCRDEPMILADSIQIEQVLMNLATNARDAMPDGGTLLIETENMDLGETFVRTHAYGKPGQYVLISVTDTGSGMDEPTRNRIFEPFFTTKEVGKGTGLGLAMVYGITKQHNGYILVYSEPGQGTTFKVYFPRITSVPDETAPPEQVMIPQGVETILIAEDDSTVRQLTHNVLEDFGYRVIEADDGEEAVKKFLENRDQIQLLVLDIIMPKKNGKETYQEINKIQPGIKVLFTSGYTADIIHRKGILDTGLDFILKPISPALFLKKVREVLDKK